MARPHRTCSPDAAEAVTGAVAVVLSLGGATLPKAGMPSGAGGASGGGRTPGGRTPLIGIGGGRKPNWPGAATLKPAQSVMPAAWKLATVRPLMEAATLCAFARVVDT